MDASAAAVTSGPPVLEGCGASQGNGDGDTSCQPTLGMIDPVASGPGPALPGDAGLAADASACPLGFEGFGAPEPISGLDSIGELFGPALSPDGLSLYFSVSLTGAEQIYGAVRVARDSTVFADPLPVESLNSTALDGSPFVSGNGLRVYFFSDRGGGVGGRDIWFSERADAGAALSLPVLLGGVNTPSLELLPWLSADELLVLFVSSRPLGMDSNIWQATRTSVDAAFGAPVNLAALSSAETEGRVALSSDGLHAIFSSDRPGSVGGADIWTASRPDALSAFSEPRSLPDLNSGAAEQDVALSSDERELFFASSRNGASSLWRSVRGCP